MAHPIECPGEGCALHGAIYAALAVRGATPIVHGPAGCGYQAALAAPLSGWLDPGGIAVPSTNLSEKQVVFGGTARLREEIKNAVKVADGALYAVLSTCPTEMIGDDIPAMAKEARAQGFPVIDVPSAGFRGALRAGYVEFLKAVIGSGLVVDKGARDQTLVNVFGLVPGADAAWVGEIEEWSRLLAGLGLRANVVFGPSGGVADLRRVGNAALTLVLSPAGRGPAEAIQQRFGVPWLEASALPVGALATADLLRRIGDLAGRPRDDVETFAASERERENWFLERLSHAYHALDLQRGFALVTTGSRSAGLSAFLTGTLGWLPRLVVVAEPLAPDEKARLVPEIEKAAPGAEVIFVEGAGEIADAIAAAKPEIILARAIEAGVASRLGVPLVQISTPVSDRIVLDTPLSGSRGALALIEAIGGAVLRQ